MANRAAPPADVRTTDVLVVGFGGAGACAALEARSRGAQVLVLDRFEGGGATAISGGVVYAGDTHIQREAGVADSVDDMVAYLSAEVGDVVSEATLRDFCAQSGPNIAWLASHGVPFDASLCPVKTSYPTDDWFLYYSGNEGFLPFRERARPAPRGHRAKGTSLPGRNLFAPLADSAQRNGVAVLQHCRATDLVRDNGRVVGVDALLLEGRDAWWHGWFERTAINVVNYLPKVAKALRSRAARLEQVRGRRIRVRAHRGVILTTGGFIYNRQMVTEHAPGYRRGMPLGTGGCNGDGHRMGAAIGGTLQRMDRVSAWRFLNPPAAFTKGMLIDRAGRRFVNEALYGAAVGEAMVEQNEGQGLLIIDERLKRLARSQLGRGQTQWFQTAPALLNLWFNCRRASSVEALARLCKVDLQVLRETLATYNGDTVRQGPDAFGKDDRAELRPPFYVVDVGIRSKVWPLPTLTLGGLAVDEATGGVTDGSGHIIPGLFAAGRAAVGVCAHQYVSGLSIADCVYSGRRAGREAAQRHTATTRDNPGRGAARRSR